MMITRAKQRTEESDMALYYEEEVSFDVDFDVREVAWKVIDEVADMEQIPYEFDVYLTMVDNDSIHEINYAQRGIDAPTDVLSFPNLDFIVPGDFSLLEENEFDYFDMESGMLLLGDIVISVDKVKEQAIEYGHSMKREFAFLVAHSMLHLCGYDHMETEEAIVMEEKQKRVLDNVNITRED